ncbi:MAG: N-acetylneuraminate synthase [Parcubacteria group bacterium GW2011_GWC2_45_7]|nr:MAG: N-acetylneuraminate synthase [Parcubacteria group bacterium GW2011_GWC2_45_7]
MFKSTFKIGENVIGEGYRCFIIAEVSANHDQKFEYAAKLIEAAKEAGADAVKLQTYTADTLTINVSKGNFLIPKGNTFEGPKNLYELYKTAYMPWEWQPKLMNVAKKLGIALFSTAYEETAVDFLEQKVKIPAHKVASFEMTDDILLAKMSKTKKPIIMSTGMATLEEIDHAVDVIGKNGCSELAILRCSSAYPATPEEMHLNGMNVLRNIYSVPVGVSDHSLGMGVSVAAVALGANVIEKHIMLPGEKDSPDHSFSMIPSEFKQMVEVIRQAESAVKGVHFGPSSVMEEAHRKLFRRSLYITEDTKKGEKLTKNNCRAIRPGGGLDLKHYQEILGMTVKTSVTRGTPVSWDLIK